MDYKLIIVIFIQVLTAGVVWGTLIQSVKEIERRLAELAKATQKQEDKIVSVEKKIDIIEAVDRDRKGREHGG